MATTKPNIFIVEDDPFYLSLLKKSVTGSRSCEVQTFATGEAFLEKIYQMPDVILLDQNLEGKITGLEVLKRVKSLNPDIQVIFLSAQEKMNIAIQSLKYGAFDYVIKDDLAFSKVNKLIAKILRYKRAEANQMINRQIQRVVIPGILLLIGGVLTLNYYFPHLFD